MAYISNKTLKKSQDNMGLKKHNKVESNYWIFDTDDGEKIIQINTYGSDDRKIKGKMSQAIQLNDKVLNRILSDMNSMYNDSVIDNKHIIKEDSINNILMKKGENRIYYGAPGTGKSYIVDEIANAEFQFVHRTTFYPEYTHDDFVGAFMPVMNYEMQNTDNDKSDNASFRNRYVYGDGTPSNIKGKPVPFYKFVSGPFANALVDAMNNLNKNILLIVEELNRANAAAVFGEVFQLLDRKYNGNADDGESRYSVNISNEFSEFIAENVADYKLGDKIVIPSNMSIYATMNSADQGVNPLDSAFKRRWNFVYIPIDFENADHKNAEIHYAGRKVTWQNFGQAINKKLVELGINEDKLLGEYFVNKAEVKDPDKFETKIISYLFEDIFKFNRRGFFKPEYKTFSQLKNNFADKEIFELQFDYKAEENALSVTYESVQMFDENIDSNQMVAENLEVRN